jgi:hypothetical protein
MPDITSYSDQSLIAPVNVSSLVESVRVSNFALFSLHENRLRGLEEFAGIFDVCLDYSVN